MVSSVAFYPGETLGERLDRRFGAAGTFWAFVDGTAIPLISRMTLAMFALMFVAALVHGDYAFMAILGALALLSWRLRAEA